MITQIKKVLQNREHAARLLTEKLLAYKDSNAIVVAVPRGGMPIGYCLAKKLKLPLDVVLSRRIKHPANREKSIGAVCADNVVLHEESYSIPQSVMYHQITQLQHWIKKQKELYHSHFPEHRLTGKTVILVDDVLNDADTLQACLNAITKQQPEKIIVAAPVITSKAAAVLTKNDLLIVYLFMVMNQSVNDTIFYPEVDETRALQLFSQAAEEIHALPH